MSGAPLPPDESARLLSLARSEILDTPAEAAFDRITRLAIRVLGTPVAFINFVDQARQWSKAACGLDDTTAPRHDSFCAWTILQPGPLVIENAHADPRFAHNPMVTGAPHIHMYAGVPLTTPTGHRIGTLCVTADQPHPLSADDLQALEDLAELVVSELELRVQTLELKRDLNAQARRNAELQRGLDHAHVLEGVTALMDLDLLPEDMTLSAARLLAGPLGMDYIGLLVFEGEGIRVVAAHQHPQFPLALLGVPDAPPDWANSVTRRLRELNQPHYVDDYPALPHALPAMVAAGTRQVAWMPLGTRAGVTSLLITVRMQGNPVPRWRGSDRALLGAAGRSIRSALDRRLDVEQTRQEARRDALTGLPNRRALDRDLIRRQQEGRPFVLAGLDLDGLKALNDQQGHAQGDRMLQVFAATLQAAMSQAGEVYRVGGDEFVVLGAPGEDAVHDAVDAAVLAAREVGGLRGASVGVAHSSEAVGEGLLALADQRMYAVKRRRQTARQDELKGGGPGVVDGAGLEMQ